MSKGPYLVDRGNENEDQDALDAAFGRVIRALDNELGSAAAAAQRITLLAIVRDHLARRLACIPDQALTS